MRRQIIFSALAFLAATIVLLVPLSGNSILLNEIQNSGHSLLFGILAIFAIRGFGVSSSPGKVGTIRLYLLAFILTLCFGVVTEIAQHFTCRDGDPYDVLMDAVGIVSFIGFYWTVDRSQAQLWTQIGTWRKIAVRAVSILIVTTAFIPATLWCLAFLNRNHEFPAICDFDSRLSTMFIIPQESVLEIAAPPPGWTRAQHKVGRVSFTTGTYPGIRIDEPFPDWRGFSLFCFSIYSDNLDTLRFELRIDDSHHNFQFNDRFNAHFLVCPGVNSYAFPLERVKAGPVNRETDMANIASFTIFSGHPSRPFVLYFNEIGLK